MDDFAGCDPGCNAGPDRAFEDPAEALGAPALANARQGRVVGQRFMKAVADEPADRDVDRCLAHQATIMNDAEQETGQHQANRNLRIDARSTVVEAI